MGLFVEVIHCIFNQFFSLFQWPFDESFRNATALLVLLVSVSMKSWKTLQFIHSICFPNFCQIHVVLAVNIRLYFPDVYIRLYFLDVNIRLYSLPRLTKLFLNVQIS